MEEQVKNVLIVEIIVAFACKPGREVLVDGETRMVAAHQMKLPVYEAIARVCVGG
jgi:hypothetical protein